MEWEKLVSVSAKQRPSLWVTTVHKYPMISIMHHHFFSLEIQNDFNIFTKCVLFDSIVFCVKKKKMRCQKKDCSIGTNGGEEVMHLEVFCCQQPCLRSSFLNKEKEMCPYRQKLQYGLNWKSIWWHWMSLNVINKWIFAKCGIRRDMSIEFKIYSASN